MAKDDGTTGHAEGEAVEKQLDGWTEGSVFIKDRHSRKEYKFPAHVFPPESSQEDVYKGMGADLVDLLTINQYNVMLLAYGQTGTGKTHAFFFAAVRLEGPREKRTRTKTLYFTPRFFAALRSEVCGRHTMFGTPESLRSAEPHPGWGVLPRVCSASSAWRRWSRTRPGRTSPTASRSRPSSSTCARPSTSSRTRRSQELPASHVSARSERGNFCSPRRLCDGADQIFNFHPGRFPSS